MTKLDKEIVEYMHFSAMKMKSSRLEFSSISTILVCHLASLYYETNPDRIHYFLKELNALLSNVKRVKLKTGKMYSTLSIFKMLWVEKFDDNDDGEDCKKSLESALKDREEHEGVRFPTNGNLEPLAIFCRNFIYEISKLLSNKDTRDFGVDELEFIYKTLSFGVIHNFDKKLNLYW